MSGHSKWASIKRQKGATDAKRGQLFSKLVRAIIVAARDGGPDPAANLALQNAIEKAREASMPKDNIERAIAKGSGTGADAAAYETVMYEGYGPGGVALFVEALTDNRNRTAADVRQAFTKSDGNLGESGSVAWLFERKGVILVEGAADEDELVLAAADAGADDVEPDESSYRVTTAPESLHAVRAALEEGGLPIESAESTMVPKTQVSIEDETTARKVVRLMDDLEENDDVQAVYSNFDIPEQVLEAVAGLGPGKLVPVRGPLLPRRLEPRVHLLEVGRLLLHARPVTRRELRHRVVQFLVLRPCTGHQDHARPVACAHEDVLGPGGTVEEVPRPKEPLLTLDEQPALP